MSMAKQEVISPAIDPDKIAYRDTAVTFLEMHDRPTVTLASREGVTVNKWAGEISPEAYRQIYFGVGREYHWVNRMLMPDEDLYNQINASNVEVWLLHVGTELAGYVEFSFQGNYTEIVYFGLMPQFVGQGLGGYFLRWAVNHAWSSSPEWIQVNTCTLDHDNALPTYKKNGFQEVRVESQSRRVIVA